MKICVDFSKPVGKMKPMHAVGQPPILVGDDTELFHFLREAGIPQSRLHDAGYFNTYYVDVPHIFRDFSADENDPASYDFHYTDEYIYYIQKSGAESYYRLGITIEWGSQKYTTVAPPSDFEKWARICEHIIRHYTEGWASGYRWNIRYYEIWNESDSCYKGRTSTWAGTPEQFYEFYCVSASYLKKCFPHLKIGGCAYTRGYNRFIEDFFKYITSKNERIPLDFYSWHRYCSDVDDIIRESERVDLLPAHFKENSADNP